MENIDVVDAHPHKSSMDREVLREVITLSLFAGQMLLQNGADSKRVEEIVHRLGTGLGCDWLDVAVLPDAIIASTVNNHEFRTKVRRAPGRGINMDIIAQVSDLAYRLDGGEIDALELRLELRRISEMPHNYNRWHVVGGVGLACAAFSQLFGGDIPIFLMTFLASAVAMFVRQEMHRHYFNDLVTVMVTAFVAGCIASFVYIFNLSPDPGIALAACVLLLVPGVQLVNAAEDLIQGYHLNGVIRGVLGLLIALSIALGLSMAMWLMRVPGL